MTGKLVHVEIGAENPDRAQGFWSGVFGWEVGPPMSPEMDYRMFQTAEDQGGAIVATDEKGPLRVYFDTGDIDGGSSAKVTLKKAGTYKYHCNIHSFMHGTLKAT